MMADEEPQSKRGATSIEWYVFYSLVSADTLLSIL